jgi:hypothetical protein
MREMGEDTSASRALPDCRSHLADTEEPDCARPLPDVLDSPPGAKKREASGGLTLPTLL